MRPGRFKQQLRQRLESLQEFRCCIAECFGLAVVTSFDIHDGVVKRTFVDRWKAVGKERPADTLSMRKRHDVGLHFLLVEKRLYESYQIIR